MNPVVPRPAGGVIRPPTQAGRDPRARAGEQAAGQQPTGQHPAGQHPTGQPAAAGDRPARLKVGVVGAGRVGAVLGAALARAGHRVVAVSAVSSASRDRASRLLPGAALTEPAGVVAAADLILLTVPDDALPALVSGLAGTGVPMDGRLVAHASGRYGAAVLDPATRRGALPLALHPVMTFTGRPEDVERLTGVCFGVTAPDALLLVAEALVIEMGGEPVVIAEDARDLYHAALAGAANHLTTLVTESAELLRGAGVRDPARVLGPLLSAALDNALRLGIAGLTGPVARGDAGTVASHIEALRKVSPPAAVGAYVAMARLTADRAIAAGLLTPQDAERLLDVLSGPPE
ncbi:MAG TPA: DUF2520 domain-containing protein [Streptosporangiaceae bacterium]|nr:DUF2520 domain-containing protein [Streptosporangiaceae bacterium]